MKVYILIFDDYSCGTIVKGVFSSKKLAEDYANDNFENAYEYFIYDYIVDKP